MEYDGATQYSTLTATCVAEREALYSSAIHALAALLIIAPPSETDAHQRELVKLGYIYWTLSHSSRKVFPPTEFLDGVIRTYTKRFVGGLSPFFLDPLFLGDDFFHLDPAAKASRLEARFGKPPINLDGFTEKDYTQTSDEFTKWLDCE